jgi:hypothetical protein
MHKNGLYALHLACNDPDTGRLQGFVELIEVHTETSPQECLLTLERYGHPLLCRFEGAFLRLGGLLLLVQRQGSWVGNRCWDSVSVEAGMLHRVLRLLAQGNWQLSAGTDAGLRLWAEAEDSCGQGTPEGRADGFKS